MPKISNTRDVVTAIADGATHMSVLNVKDGARITDAGIDARLDYYPDAGATITVTSSLDGWLNATPESTVISEWSGEDRNRFFVPSRHDGARVILRGWPDDAVKANRYLKGLEEAGVALLRGEDSAGSVHVSDAQVLGPSHYVWLGGALADSGAPELTAELQSWHVLDAISPTDPHVWNTLKYLMRLGRKGGEEKRLEDLRKAAVYLERAIQQEYRRANR